MIYPYRHAAVGGTFDHFHRGHQHLLNEAFSQAEKVTIGLTLPELYQYKVLADTIESYRTREQHLQQFLHHHHWQKRSEIIPLKDTYGSTLDDESLEALFVTEETKLNALRINQKRELRGLSPLAVITVPFIRSEDGAILSSESIRLGIHDQEGKSYLCFFEKKESYTLPPHLRKQLQKPLGVPLKELTSLINKKLFIVAIGDITTITLLKENISPAIAFIDLKTRRHDLDQQLITRYFSGLTPAISNPAGTITNQAARIYQQALRVYLQTHKTQILVVEGEEDLLALPAVLLGPLNSVVLYGQPDSGMMMITITEQEKRFAQELLDQF